MCTDQPPINDEWIRFTDKPTINHQSIVYQQTGRIRSGSDSFVRFFHRVQPNAANNYHLARYYQEFYPLSALFTSPNLCPGQAPSLPCWRKTSIPGVDNQIGIYEEAFVFFPPFFPFFSLTDRCITAVPKFHYMPGQPFREALVSIAIVPCPLNGFFSLDIRTVFDRDIWRSS